MQRKWKLLLFCRVELFCEHRHDGGVSGHDIVPSTMLSGGSSSATALGQGVERWPTLPKHLSHWGWQAHNSFWKSCGVRWSPRGGDRSMQLCHLHLHLRSCLLRAKQPVERVQKHSSGCGSLQSVRLHLQLKIAHLFDNICYYLLLPIIDFGYMYQNKLSKISELSGLVVGSTIPNRKISDSNPPNSGKC